MCANIKELRKEAYQLWGLTPKKVIYDFPQAMLRSGKYRFQFKLDYDDANASWPRAYALAIEDDEPILRSIIPIIFKKEIGDVYFEVKGWYDMPLKLHEQITEIVETDNHYQPLGMLKRWANGRLPESLQFTNKVPVENYLFSVTLHHNDLILKLL